MNWKATIAFLLLAGSAYAQTATPTNTPTNTPTITPTPTNTNTPLPTSTPVNPFTTDYLTINKLTGILYGNGTSPVTVVTFTPASTPTNTPTNTPTPTATPTFTPVSTATPRATDTPLVFSTPGDLVIFAATELGDYAGSSICSAGSLVTSLSKSGAVTCATPVPVATATPQPAPTLVPTATPIPPVATATPRATDTPANTPTPENPFGNLSYSGKLNVTGATAISASATPAANDRTIDCTSGSSAVTYTMPPATGTGRIIDVWKVDAAGSGTCILGRAGSDTLNGATTITLGASAIGHETCRDKGTNVWLCAGSGT